MAVRKRITGRGFSRRVELALFTGTAKDIADTLRTHKETRPWTFEGQVREIETVAKEILAAHMGQTEADSSEDYAYRALHFIGYVRHAIQEADADKAARWAFELGELVREHDLKVEHERSAGIGHTQRSAGMRGVDMRHGDEDHRARRRAARVATVAEYEAAGLGRDAAVAAAAAKHDVSPRTIYRELKR